MFHDSNLKLIIRPEIIMVSYGFSLFFVFCFGYDIHFVLL